MERPDDCPLLKNSKDIISRETLQQENLVARSGASAKKGRKVRRVALSGQVDKPTLVVTCV